MKWKTEKRKISDLTEWKGNPRILTEKGMADLKKSIQKFGCAEPLVINVDGTICGGHGRKKILEALGIKEVDCYVPERPLTPAEFKELNIRLNKNIAGEFDFDILANDFEIPDLIEWGFTEEELSIDLDAGSEVDAEPKIDQADELRKKWGVELGQVWQLGDHRIICGDSTKAEDVARVLGAGEIAVLCHADPPYGMGKENEGIQNDNLYKEKLDAFQMQWWKTARPFIANNGSAYIWGTSEDLWRFWYVGGLRTSERLTFRNEIIWDKESGQGMNSEKHRMYPTATERCLFFMLGEQGFNNNADNYWDGWDSIVNYLQAEKEKTGWNIAKFKRLAGHSETSGCHWFDKSQWTFPTKEVYEAWQQAAREHDAFKREHDDLKREFYSTRAYFDNTHDTMSDVWTFPIVIGCDRQGHPTPKPIPMIERIIKTSSKKGDIVVDMFLGSGTTLIAAERTGRVFRGCELSPAYVAVSIQRWVDATGGKPKIEK
jgi:DNA modification methylase